MDEVPHPEEPYTGSSHQPFVSKSLFLLSWSTPYEQKCVLDKRQGNITNMIPNDFLLLHSWTALPEANSPLTWRHHFIFFSGEQWPCSLRNWLLFPSCFTLSCKPLQCPLKVMVWRHQQNHIDSEDLKPDPLLLSPCNAVHEHHKDQRQRAVLAESNLHRKQTLFCTENTETALVFRGHHNEWKDLASALRWMSFLICNQTRNL